MELLYLSVIFELEKGAPEYIPAFPDTYVVPEAIHIGLYDRVDKIPFDKLEDFFKKNLH